MEDILAFICIARVSSGREATQDALPLRAGSDTKPMRRSQGIPTHPLPVSAIPCIIHTYAKTEKPT